jgi:AmmeMemoRadiSam system protein B
MGAHRTVSVPVEHGPVFPRYNTSVLDVRPAAVAGSFYPASASMLAKTVTGLLSAAQSTMTRVPKALIVPHAGYIYSGHIAATAFTSIAGVAHTYERVVLIGPAHRKYVDGLASPGAARMATPLGEVEVDVASLDRIAHRADAAAHAQEHCLEVMLPFVQMLARNAKVIPLLASEAAPEVVGAALEALWGGHETLIVISSDLSHYLPYGEGRRLDEETCARVLAREYIDSERACGSVAINGMSWVARRRNLDVELLSLRSSGDTAGDESRVVGYGAFAYV